MLFDGTGLFGTIISVASIGSQQKKYWYQRQKVRR